MPGKSKRVLLSKEKDFEHFLAKDKKALQKLSILTSQIRRCKEILARLSSASQDIHQKKMTKITIDQFISEMIDRWRDTRLSTQLSFKKTYLNKNLKIIYDRALSQAIQNLLDNAANASEDKVEFSIETNKKYLFMDIGYFSSKSKLLNCLSRLILC